MDRIFGDLKAKLDGTIVIKACAREPAEIAEFAAQLDDAHGPRVLETPAGRRLLQPERADRRRGHGPGVRRRGRSRCSGGG